MRTSVSTLLLCSLFLLPFGCADEGDVAEDLDGERSTPPPLPPEDSELAYGMLRVANELDFETLDVTVALDKRAAESIIGFRAGADELLGTADDQFLRTLAELDALFFLGPVNLGKIQTYAISEGFVPASLPAPSCEPEVIDAVEQCLRFTEAAAGLAQNAQQGWFGVAPFKDDLLPSCLLANDPAYPSADFFTDAGLVGFFDPQLGYQGLLCELSSNPVCERGVASLAVRSQPECLARFSPSLELDDPGIDPATLASWEAELGEINSACFDTCDYSLRVYSYEAGMAPTLFGDTMEATLPLSPLGFQGAWFSAGTSDQLPVGGNPGLFLGTVLDDLGLSGESFDVGIASDEIPCPNCNIFYDSFVLLFRDAQTIVAFDNETFWDG